MTQHKLTFYMLLMASVMAFNCSGQSKKETNGFQESSYRETNYRAIMTVFLKKCLESGADSKACEIVLHGYYPRLTLTEAYITKVENDQTIAKAGGNEFEVRRAKEAMISQENRVSTTLASTDLSKLELYSVVSVGTSPYSPSKYDFSSQNISLTIDDIAGVSFDGKNNQTINLAVAGAKPFKGKPLTIKIPLTTVEAEKLFAGKDTFHCFIKVTLGEVFEQSFTDRGIYALLTKVEVFDKVSGTRLGEVIL